MMANTMSILKLVEFCQNKLECLLLMLKHQDPAAITMIILKSIIINRNGLNLELCAHRLYLNQLSDLVPMIPIKGLKI